MMLHKANGGATVSEVDSVASRPLGQGAIGEGRLAFADANAALAQLMRYSIDLKRLVRDRDAVLQQIKTAHLSALNLLCRAAEFRDDDTGVHMDRVGALAQLLTKEIVELQEGQVQIESQAQQGTAVTLWFPLAADFVLSRPSPMQDPAAPF